MKLKHIKNIIFILLIIFILFPTNIALAVDRGRPLEVIYPDIPRADTTPTETTTPIPQYVQYVYYFLIALGAIIALVVLTMAGIQYMTSAGNPGKMQDAKERIISALLGLLILVGSFAILHTINPRLTTLEIPDIIAYIPPVPTGVVLCKTGVNVGHAWDLSQEYYYYNPSDARREAIKEELVPLVETINKECYPHNASGDIAQEFDNKATTIWFIPLWWWNYDDHKWYSNEYGAVAYDETGFKGISYAYVNHLIDPTQPVQPYSASISNASSLIPFRLIYEPDWTWHIIVYNNYNYNDGIAKEDAEQAQGDFEGRWWNYFAKGAWGDWYPKSMKTEGEILTVLHTEKNKNESFFSNNVPNLEAYDNIIEWEKCEGYEGERDKGGDWVDTGYSGSGNSANVGGYFTKRLCAHSKVTGIFIIAAERL